MTRLARSLLAAGFVLGAGLVWPGWARADFEFVPLLDANLAYTGSRFVTQDSGAAASTPIQYSGSGDVYLAASPNFHFTEVPGLWITPALEFEYSGANNLLSIDDETFLFAKRLDLYYLLGANWALNETWSAKLKGFGRLENVAETADENLNTGLYDYRDYGAWGELSAAYALFVPQRTKLGYKGYLRRYPNYSNAPFVTQYEQSVGPWPASIPQDLREKDMNVSEAWLRQEIGWGDLPLLTNLELRGRLLNYTQMPVIVEDGTLSPTGLRRDTYVDLTLEVPWLLSRYHQLELDYGYRLRLSDQNYYDMNDKVFLGGYYNYYQNSIGLLYNVTIPWKFGGFPARGSLAVSWTDRQYLTRPPRQTTSATDEVGQYNFDAKHHEITTDICVTLRQTLWAKWFNLFASVHFIAQNSNTDVSDNAAYNYQYQTITLGTGFTF